MWNLRRHPHGQLAASTVIRGEDPTWLHRHRHQALLGDFETHDFVSLAEPLIGHPYGFCGRLRRWAEDAKHNVVIEFVVHPGGTWLGRLLWIDHRWEDVHVHLDEIDRILGDIRVAGHYHRHRLANKPHFAHRQGMVHGELHAWSSRTARDRPHLAEEIGSGQHGDHARVVFGRLDVEAPDAGMCIRAAKE